MHIGLQEGLVKLQICEQVLKKKSSNLKFHEDLSRGSRVVQQQDCSTVGLFNSRVVQQQGYSTVGLFNCGDVQQQG